MLPDLESKFLDATGLYYFWSIHVFGLYQNKYIGSTASSWRGRCVLVCITTFSLFGGSICIHSGERIRRIVCRLDTCNVSSFSIHPFSICIPYSLSSRVMTLLFRLLRDHKRSYFTFITIDLYVNYACALCCFNSRSQYPLPPPYCATFSWNASFLSLWISSSGWYSFFPVATSFLLALVIDSRGNFIMISCCWVLNQQFQNWFKISISIAVFESLVFGEVIMIFSTICSTVSCIL